MNGLGFWLFSRPCFFTYGRWLNQRFSTYSLAPVFFTTSRFFQEHLTYPGGLANYAASFTLQCYRVSWLGALITTGLAAILYLATRFLLVRTGWAKAEVVPVIPSVLLILVQSEYGVPVFPRVLSIVAAVAVAAGYVGSSQDWRWRGALFLALSAPIYLALGGAYLLFALVCAIFEIAVAKRLILSFLMFVVAALLPWVACHHVFVLSLRDAYLYLVPFTGIVPGSWDLKALFVAVPVLVILAAIRRRVLSIPQAASHGETDVPPGLRSGASIRPNRRASVARPAQGRGARVSWKQWVREVLSGDRLEWIGHPGLWLPVFALIIALSHPTQGKLLAEIDWCAGRSDWARIIELGRKVREPDSASVHDINRALAHGDLLLDRMFEFPQKREWEFWINLSKSMDLTKLVKSSELLLELGHVNRAERMAAESLELNGYSPEILQQLFLISVLKGQPKTGLPFLNLLSCTLWHRGWAESYRQALEIDPALSNDVGLQKVRPLMVRQDYVGAIPDNVLMQISLRQNPENRLSFQYLMAFYLLSGQLEKVAQNLERVRALQLPVLPRHLQEAIVLFEKTNPGTQLDLHGLAISPSIEQRYQRFNEAAVRCTAETAPVLLAKEFGDSYWYFFIAGHSGSSIPKGGMPK